MAKATKKIKESGEISEMMAMAVTKEDVYGIWDKVSQSIARCDTKISISLGFAGVFMGAFFADERSYQLVKSSIQGVFRNIGFNSNYILNIFIVLFSIGFIAYIVGVIWYLLNGLRSSFDERKISVNRLKSKLYWTEIAKNDFIKISVLCFILLSVMSYFGKL